MKGCSSATVMGASPSSASVWLVAAVRSGAVSTSVPSRSKTMVVSRSSRGMDLQDREWTAWQPIRPWPACHAELGLIGGAARA